MNKSLLIKSGLSLLVFCLCFCGQALAGPSGKPFKIGLLAPITGTQAVMAEDMIEGAEMAVEETNKAGGVLGRPLKLIVEDTEVRPAPGMDAARKLIQVDQVPVLTGGFSSGVSLPIAKYAQSQKLLYLLAVPTSPLFRDVGDFCLSVTVVDTFKGKAIADFIDEDTDKDKIGLVFMNNAFGKKLMEAAKKNLEDLDKEVVTTVMYELNKVDYKAELQRLYAKDPQLVVGSWYAKEGQIMTKQAYEMGLLDVNKVPWYVPEVTTSFASAMKEIPEVLDGIKGLDPLQPKQLFSEKFKARTGHDPITAYSAQYYDAVRMLAMAVNFAQSEDPAAIRDALSKIDDWYRGMSYGGDKRFDEDGMQAYAAFRKVVIQDGKVNDY